MKSLRLRISHLRNKIIDNLSDDEDLYGYLGISKIIIIESLNESYNLLATLQEYNDKFETIFAKRAVANYIDELNDFIDNDLERRKVESKFDNFLRAIANIRFTLKESYISLSTEPFRVDYELAKAKESLSTLSSDLEDIKNITTEIQEIKNSSESYILELETKHKSSIENEEKINEFVDNIEQIDEKITTTNEKIILWKSEIQTIREDIGNKQVDISKLKKETEQIKESNIESQSIISEQENELEEQLNKNIKQQEKIQKTIEDVSRYGMAGSFKKRKDELKIAQVLWATLTILTLGGLITVSYYIVKPILASGIFEINQLLYKIPVFASCVWLGWFCSKQYGYISRIREDYSYKYAISMAFEGYKNETREVDSKLLEKLIELTVLNVSKNPVSNYNTSHNHGSPYNEMFDNLTQRFFNDNTEKEK